MRHCRSGWLHFCYALALCVLPAPAEVVITEFMALNNTTLRDQDGDYSDWIELFNTGPGTVNLENWALTDNANNLTKWRFPATNLPPGGYLVVFASNKDRRVPGGELHTNFRLDGGGEFLALVDSATNIVQQFAPVYPPQVTDISYGPGTLVATNILADLGTPVRVLVPAGDIGTAWKDLAFDDSGWLAGTLGVGYDFGNNYAGVIGADLRGQMLGSNTTAYARVPFTVPNLSAVDELMLRMSYDDGFVAYLNGVEVARRNAPVVPAWNSSAPASPEGVVLRQDFEPGASGFTLGQHGSAPAASIQSTNPGSTGRFLRLITDGANGQVNSATFDGRIPGDYTTLIADFDFRMASGDAPADGFGLLLLPTANYGTNGAGASIGFAAEEPNLAGVLAFGFDVYDHNVQNDVSAHWNGSEVVNVTVPKATLDMVSDQFHHARIRVRQAAGGVRVTVTLFQNVNGGGGAVVTPINDVLIPGASPYDFRPEFIARSGGLNMTVDLDNVRITTYQAQVFAEDFSLPPPDANFATNGAAPGAHVSAAEGGSTGPFLRLATDGVNGQNNTVAFAQQAPGAFKSVVADFDFRLADAGGCPADGFSFLLLPTRIYGASGAGAGGFTAEDPNVADVFALGFPVYPHPARNAVTVHWNGGKVADVNLPTGSIDLVAGVFHRAHLELVHGVGGSYVTVILTPSINDAPGAPLTVVRDLFVAGLNPYSFRPQFSARTGGCDMGMDVDNLVIQGFPGALAEDFDGANSTYTLHKNQNDPPPSVQGADGGSSGSFLRLITDGANDNKNGISFDQTHTGPYSAVTAEFDFRLSDAGGPADGFSFLLIPTATYGSSGQGIAVNNIGAEEPNAAGVFGVAFDMYPHNTQNDVSVHWNGSERVNVTVPTSTLDFVNSGFHRAQVGLVFEAAGARVTVTITPNINSTPGTPLRPVDNWFVPGLLPFDCRVEFVARSGGLNMSVDLDNIKTTWHPPAGAVTSEDFNLTAYRTLLVVPGANVLAIQGLNAGLRDPDFLIWPKLLAKDITILTNTMVYSSPATPGSVGTSLAPGVTAAPQFLPPAGIYTNTVSLVLTSATPGAVIRYTLDGSLPTADSPIYSGPLAVAGSKMVRARAFATGQVDSPVVSAAYSVLSGDLLGFDSNLPLVIINPHGQTIINDISVPASMMVIDTAFNGRARFTYPLDFQGRIGIEFRGSSSLGFPKKSYNVEIWDEYNADRDASLLGMPEESDWALYAPYTDKTFMNDVLAYELWEDMGHYSVRRRFVEVFVDQNNNGLGADDYAGIYVLLEKIKIGKDRVDVAPLGPADNAEPEVTGGYVIKKDKDMVGNPNDAPWNTSSGIQLGLKDPDGTQITAAQRNWIIGWLNAMESALYGPNFTDPLEGYAKYIDADSFIDHQWIVEFPKNIDGYRLSNFYTKDRNGKLKEGPIWDWNLSFGNADYGTGEFTNGWYYSIVGDADYPWYRRLFADPDFNQRYIDRWWQLRTNVLATARVVGRVQEIASLLNEAQARDFAKWPRLGTYVWPNPTIGVDYVTPTTYAGIINNMTNWIVNRLAWIDTQFLAPPVLGRAGGPVNPGDTVALSAPAGAIYYTLDGADPRAPGGGLSASAFNYSAPVAIHANARLVARAYDGGHWSGPVAATYVVATPPLAITEIMYHPTNAPGGPYPPDDFEYLELKNIGGQPLDLAGFQFADGIRLTLANPLNVIGDPTLQTWDGGGAAHATTQLLFGPPARTNSGGPTANYLRLVSDQSTGSRNRIAFDQTASGGYDAVVAEFDFRATLKSDVVVTGAPTAQNFDAAGTPFSVFSGDANVPTVTVADGGSSGSFLRIVNGGNGGQNDTVAFDRTASGVFPIVTATFDFRLTPVIGQADGLGFAFANTANYGDSGPINTFIADAVGVVNSLGVGFDIYNNGGEDPNDNHLNLYWNGTVVGSTATPPFDLSNGQFHRAKVILRFANGNAYVSVLLTPDIHGTPGATVPIFNDQLIPNVPPYEGRAAFGARTGGATAHHDIDNVLVEYGVPPPGTPIIQNFDDSGSPYTSYSWGGSTPTVTAPDGNSTGNFMRLVPAVGSSGGTISFDRSTIGPSEVVISTFDFRFTPTGSQADGIGFALLNTAHFGASGTYWGIGPEPSLVGSLGVGFDIYNNGAGDNDNNHLSLHYNNARVGGPINVPFDFSDGKFHRAQIVTRFADGNAYVTVKITRDINGTPAGDYYVFGEFSIPNVPSYECRPAFGAATGGENAHHDIDNVSIVFTNASALPTGGTATAANFDASGSAYATASFGGDSTPAVLPGDPGSSGNFLRLVPAANDEADTVAFARTAAGLFNTINAEFDFRITPGSGQADGMGLLFLNTAYYGVSGPTAFSFADEPNIANCLGVAFDIYNNGGGYDFDNNHLSLHWNGAKVSANVSPSFDLSNGKFHRAQITVRFANNTAYLTVRLTPDIHGAPGATETIFDEFPIPNVPAYESRPAFGARTGGDNAAHDIDNVNVQYSNNDPPGGISLALLPAGVFGVSGAGATLAQYNERPNVAGVFGLDLRWHANPMFQRATLHWNGGLAASALIPVGTLNLSGGVFHRAHLELTREGSNTRALLLLTPDVHGASGPPITVFSKALIAGFSPADLRAEIAGRTGGAAVNLDVDNVSVQFKRYAPLQLAAGEYAVVVKNPDAYISRYGSGTRILGVYDGNLANDGERLVLTGNLGEPILDFRYRDDWYPVTDGLGFSLVIVNDGAAFSTWGDRSSWQPGLSPGAGGGLAPVQPPVVINEVLSASLDPLPDAIELRNLSVSEATVGGWFLSDDFNTPRKYRIPDGAVIPAGGFLALTETNFNPGGAGFAFSALGDEVWLFSADALQNLTGYAHGFRFGAAETNVAFGRHVNSVGEEHFVAMSANTFGAANAAPKVGPLVISEIMFRPPDLGSNDNQAHEFIELHNLSPDALPLYDPAHPTNVWRLRGAVDFDFPPGTVIGPRGNIIVVSFNPAVDWLEADSFRAQYGLGPDAPLFGPYAGKLDNSDETIELKKPGAPVNGVAPFILVEEVHYRDDAPWPAGADGTGQSLRRLHLAAYGNDPGNWTVAGPSPGNIPPTANPDVLSAVLGRAVSVTAEKLLTNDTDADGDLLTIVAVSAASAQGGVVALDAGMITFTPHTTGWDSFTYTTSDGRGGQAQAVVAVWVRGADEPPVNVVDGPTMAGGLFRVRFAGVPGYSYQIQSGPTVNGPWTNVSNLAAGSNGLFEFTEPTGDPPPPARFYRTLAP